MSEKLQAAPDSSEAPIRLRRGVMVTRQLLRAEGRCLERLYQADDSCEAAKPCRSLGTLERSYRLHVTCHVIRPLSRPRAPNPIRIGTVEAHVTNHVASSKLLLAASLRATRRSSRGFPAAKPLSTAQEHPPPYARVAEPTIT